MLSRIILILFIVTTVARGQQALFPNKGIQPAIYVGENESIEMVFGKGNAFYYASSQNKGQSFTMPSLVDSLPGLHLGVSRGPQIASSHLSTVITAIDKKGDLYAYVLNRKTGKWQNRLIINDIPEIAKEGFNALASDGKGTFFVVWLDLRDDKKNKIFGAISKDGGQTWSKNKLIYRSPDSTVCECCQPSILMKDKQVVVMFRNWISGSRDMYVTTSKDEGNTFQPAVKMGNGTWKLNACPMDGGGISLNTNGVLTTVWRRENQLFTAKLGEPEQFLAQGRNASIAASNQNTFIAWQNQGQIWLSQSGQKEPMTLGTGRFPRVAILNEQQAFCTWEDNGIIKGLVLNSNAK
ncbi:sialidase family protein [Runella sp. MFBS21]|uniref:sialidase family protein n=1 Tax=Runella sp. MFBS21 TaxID=3034018 RepID=UPI0023F700A2|nr:sialidase family protein [Runella sp. MFBS21]MCA0233100.1 glycoside hydrolase [Bacteroidota bacterium]MDF7821222.1 sialidase family protein [Runella sp. MFBS21]